MSLDDENEGVSSAEKEGDPVNEGVPSAEREGDPVNDMRRVVVWAACAPM